MDITTGRERQQLDHEGQVSQIAISPDGTTLICVAKQALGERFDKVVTWKVTDWSRVRLGKCPRSLEALAFKGNALLGAVGGWKNIEVWDCDTERTCIRFHHFSPEEEQEDREDELKLSCIALSQDGRFVASASESRVKMWDLESGLEVASDEFFEGEPKEIAFSTDTSLVAFITDCALYLWDWRSPCSGSRQIAEWAEHNGGHSIALSSDGTRLVVGRGLGRIDLWLISATPATLRNVDGRAIHFTHYEPRKEASFEAHVERSVEGIRFIQGSSRFVTTANDGTARIWDATTIATSAHRTEAGTISDLCFCPTRNLLITSTLDGTVRIWDVKQGSLVHSYERPGIAATAVRASEDNSRIAAGWADGSVHVLDACSYERIAAVHVETGVVRADFGISRDQLISVSNTGCVQLWHLADRSPTTLREGGPKGHLEDVVTTLSNDRRCFGFSPTLSGNVHVWSLSPIEEVCILATGKGVKSLAFSRRHDVLAVATLEGEIGLWNLRNRVRSDFAKHIGVNCLAFTPDDKHLVSGSESQPFRTGNEVFDLTVMSFLGPGLEASRMMIWDVGSGQCCKSIEGYGDTNAVAMESRGWRAIVRGTELVIQEVETGREVAWFPAVPRIIRAHPMSATWAAAVGSRHWIWRLITP
jgi:WD40 repeat protein